jgi:hypothetical protein
MRFCVIDQHWKSLRFSILELSHGMTLPVRESIDSRLAKIAGGSQIKDAVAFFSNGCKKDREWHVLGKVTTLLKTAGFEHPEVAEEDEEPDFRTFLPTLEPWDDVEIVEAMEPGSKRHAFYKEDEKKPRFHPVARMTGETWDPLRAVVAKKATKAYAPRVCLMVYFNIWKLAWPEWDSSFEDQLVREAKEKPFEEIDRFKRVLVMNSSMDALVELFPNLGVIVPEPEQR